jgi:hypothetical protein
MQDSQTATAQTSDNNTIVYNKGNLLLIEGIENDSLITIYNIRGQALYKSQYFHETNFSLNTPTSWGNIILVNIIDKNENKTFKVKI